MNAERPPGEVSAATPLMELRDVWKSYGTIVALKGVSFDVLPGEVHCLLGDNGAGKSTLIKILAVVHQQTRGAMLVDGEPARFAGPRDAMALGIATVHQDLSMIPLMSISRNFFLGAEPTRGAGPFRWFDRARADRIALAEVRKIGVRVGDPGQLVGTLSGGQRQALAIARARYFGARLLILDEPTAALGVKEAAVVLRTIKTQARSGSEGGPEGGTPRRGGIGVVFITHNAHHALAVGDRFTVLNHGESLGTYRKDEVTREELLIMMAGGEELEELAEELAGTAIDTAGLEGGPSSPGQEGHAS
jgi:simple sugar transport system ATP-binding protein